MNRTVLSIALLGLAVLTSCSGDSPSARPAPTVVPDAWTISSMSSSDSSPFVGNSVVVQAVIKKNGSAAPDGTVVEFLNDGDGLTSGFVNVGELAFLPSNPASVQTSGGVADIGFFATTARTYTVQARIQGVTRDVVLTYRNRVSDDSLEIYQPLIPNVGSYDGGETVRILGKGIRAPVEVSFLILGVEYPAPVQSVSEGKAGTGSITVLTPYISGEEVRSADSEADVRVTVGINSGDQESVTVPRAFTFLTSVVPGQGPVLYALTPDSGRSSGGETVTIFGKYFVPGATQVRWSGDGVNAFSSQVSVSPDGLQIDAVTPRFSIQPLESDKLVSVTVTTPEGGSQESLSFLVLADEPTPVIASFSPIAGPIDGGTLVTIFGSGFKMPVQVQFGARTATDVNLFDDRSVADNDRITCLSPDFSQQGGTPPIAVSITVTNMTSGKTASKGTFTYGDRLYITGNSPAEGRVGDSIIIFGSGFEAPLQVFFVVAGNPQLDVINVSGTQLLVRFPADWDQSCSPETAGFKVKMLESGLEATGGSYTLLGNTPRVISVSPIFVTSSSSGAFVTPNDITITGSRFSSDVLVEIGDYVMPSSQVTVVNETTIEVENIPGPIAFSLEFDTQDCTTGGGSPGTRQVQTPVDVTVRNFPGDCSDVLAGGLIYQPFDTSCVATPP